MTAVLQRLWRSTVLRWLLAIALIAALIVLFDVREAGRHLKEVDWLIAGPALAGLVLLHLIPVATWRYLNEELCGVRLGWPFATRAYYAGQLAGGLTPANVGADVYRLRALHLAEGDWRRGLLPVVVQRIASLVSMALLGIVAALFVPVGLAVRLGMLGVLGGGILLLLMPWIARSRPGLLNRLPRVRLGMEGAGSFSPRQLAAVSAFSLAFHVVGLALTVALLQSVARGGDLLPVLATLTVARAATLIPFAPGSLGTQEAAMVLLLPLAGPTAATAIALSVLLRLSMLATLAAGFVCMLRSPVASVARPIDNSVVT